MRHGPRRDGEAPAAAAKSMAITVAPARRGSKRRTIAGRRGAEPGRPGPANCYFTAKQYSRPAPPVLLRPSSLHPFEACDEFHDFAVSSGAVPLRS